MQEIWWATNEPYAKGSLSLIINETRVPCVERIIIVIASGMVIPDALYRL